jgi:purine-nucleoside phosphorylase
MSTVPETLLARWLGLRVLALSLITNLAAGLSDAPLSHAHTLAQAQAASADASVLLLAVVQALGDSKG